MLSAENSAQAIGVGIGVGVGVAVRLVQCDGTISDNRERLAFLFGLYRHLIPVLRCHY